MPKEKPRITRLGLPENTERIVIAVTESQKSSIKKAAAARGSTVSQYLRTLHDRAVEQEATDLREGERLSQKERGKR